MRSGEDRSQRDLESFLRGSTVDGVAVWADYIRPLERGDLHPDMAEEVISSPVRGLDETLTVNRLICEETAAAPPHCPWPTPPASFAPTSWHDLLYPRAVEAILDWESKALRGERAYCFLGQDAFVPEARGLVWDWLASNFCSRFSEALMHLFAVRMDASDAEVVPRLRRRHPVAGRRAPRQLGHSLHSGE